MPPAPKKHFNLMLRWLPFTSHCSAMWPSSSSSSHSHRHPLLLPLFLLLLLLQSSYCVTSRSSDLSISLQQAHPHYPHVILSPTHTPAPSIRAHVAVNSELLRRAHRVVLRYI